MAIWKNAFVEFRSVNLSGSVRAVSFTMGTEPVDITPMANTGGTRQFAAGLDTFAATMELNWNAGSTSNVDDIFAPDVSPSHPIGLLKIRPDANAVTSASNPQYSGSALVESYEHGGTIGDQHIATVSMVARAAITRTES